MKIKCENCYVLQDEDEFQWLRVEVGEQRCRVKCKLCNGAWWVEI
jgi:hypothetical protein